MDNFSNFVFYYLLRNVYIFYFVSLAVPALISKFLVKAIIYEIIAAFVIWSYGFGFLFAVVVIKFWGIPKVALLLAISATAPIVAVPLIAAVLKRYRPFLIGTARN